MRPPYSQQTSQHGQKQCCLARAALQACIPRIKGTNTTIRQHMSTPHCNLLALA